MAQSPATSRAGNRPDRVALIFIGAYHVLLAITLPLYLIAQRPGWPLLIGTLLLIVVSLLAITAGYHRLYAHRTYRVKRAAEWILVFFGTLATQGSVFRWAHDHRLHHRHVDTDGDPYGTQKGFWHSHLLWMLKEGNPIDPKYISDLKDRRMLIMQDRYYGWLVVLVNLIAVVALALITGDLVGAFVIGFVLRTFIVHHCTWFINSLAHMWGAKPYSSEHSAVNNFVLALLTLGEGYHNYHHTFSGDYRNGVRWYQFDPPKYLIWFLSKTGLAWDLKRTDPLMIKKKLVQADHKLLMSHLAEIGHVDSHVFADAIEKLSAKISSTIVSAKAVMDRYRALDRRIHKVEVKEMRAKVNELSREIAQDLKSWRQLCRMVLSLQPA